MLVAFYASFGYLRYSLRMDLFSRYCVLCLASSGRSLEIPQHYLLIAWKWCVLRKVSAINDAITGTLSEYMRFSEMPFSKTPCWTYTNGNNEITLQQRKICLYIDKIFIQLWHTKTSKKYTHNGNSHRHNNITRIISLPKIFIFSKQLRIGIFAIWECFNCENEMRKHVFHFFIRLV